MNEEIKVVIIGGIHHNTLGVIRSLGVNITEWQGHSIR